MSQEKMGESGDIDIMQLESEQKDNELTPLKYEISIVPADYRSFVSEMEKWLHFLI